MYRSGQSLKKTGRNRNWLLKKIWQRSVSVLLTVAMMVPGGALSVYASEAGIKEVDPAIEIYPEDYYEEHILNYQDVDLGYEIGSISDYGDDYIPALRSVSLPSSYGYDDFKDYMPPLRNQNPFGSCWAHSSMALAEISLRKKGIITDADLNLSELHLAYFSYNWVTDPLDGTTGDSNVGGNDGETYMSRGGNLAYSQNILASWTGAANDADALSYPTSQANMPQSIDPSYAYLDRAHLKNYYNISFDVSSDEDMQAAKQLIMDFGAIGVSFFAQSSTSASVSGGVYNTEHNAYYDPDSHNNSTNHAITIVGWDDTFPKEYFTNTPIGDGAWLVRNSWTTGSYTDH
nr:C1 family peptidase [Lachnospiraceae bacterium]